VREVRARVPASSANLGPGYDTLALALGLYVEATVDPADELSINSEGEGADISRHDLSNHLAASVVRRVLGHDRVRITLRSDIPVGRGLGSSASLAVAVAAAAGADDPLLIGHEIDGHPENAAASVLGGLVTATTIEDRPVASKLPLDEAIAFVVLVPTRHLPTKRAREALPAQVPHRDAAFNLGRMGLLIAGLADHRLLVREATEDRLHQGQRTPLFPESSRLLRGLVEAGAMATCWSGAGPSLLAFCTHATAETVRMRGEELMVEAGVGGRALVIPADHDGLVVTP
jgi:homoserine kinase